MDRVFWSRLIAEFAKVKIIPLFSGKRSAALPPSALPQSGVRTLGLCHLWTSSSQFVLSAAGVGGCVAWLAHGEKPSHGSVVPGLRSRQCGDESGTPIKGTPLLSGEEEHPPSSWVLLP